MSWHYIWIAILFPYVVDCHSLNETKRLIKDLLQNYDKDVRPVADQRTVLNVSVHTYLKSIQEFDEVNEVFSYTGAFTVEWHDIGMVWDKDNYGGLDVVMLSYKRVWVPDLILTTPSHETDTYGKPWQMINFYSHGHAIWTTGGLIKSTCSVDVSKYPFDEQICRSDFTVWGYDVNHVTLITASNSVDTSLYTCNVAWELVGSRVATSNLTSWSQLEVEIHLRRKSAFVVVSILMPILFLCLINALVFLLIPESGERISYCITVLLSIAVFLTIVSDTLPRSSEPLPIISYKLMGDMVISSLITFVTILNLRLYNRDVTESIPNWLKIIYSTCFCSRYRQNAKESYGIGVDMSRPMGEKLEKGEEVPDTDKALFITNGTHTKKDPKSEKVTHEILSPTVDESAVEVTWKDISVMVDYIALVVFTLMSVLSFGVFMVYVRVN